MYTVNATDVPHISAGLAFVQKYNLRLVFRNTGHDLLEQSTGFGSLQIWIRYLRAGITYHEQYVASNGCPRIDWTGSAFTVGGGYIWSDVYPEAWRRDLIVVGGGSPVSHETCNSTTP